MAESAFGVADQLAALDLGSNSFHLIVAQNTSGRLQVVDRIKEMVRLGEGLDAQQRLSAAARQRALECLERFGQRLRHLHDENVRIVGTNALRKARDARAFIAEAERRLGHRVEIISGREEARLIYLGVSHALEDNHDRRLVIDVGGGSTELILGRRFRPEIMESLYMGCVSVSSKRFKDGVLSKRAFRTAVNECLRELESVSAQYRSAGWDVAIGASGTMLALRSVLAALHGADLRHVGAAGVQGIIDRMVQAGHLDQVELPGLPPERRAVFPGGVAVVAALLESLGLRSLRVSDGALREGLLYDLLGRVHHQDIREQSVRNLMGRYHIDEAHAKRVRDTALSLLAQVAAPWALQSPEDRLLLAWAADLHEIGMDIAHSQYHKHGGYLLAHMDLPGFSRLDQSQLASLVRLHRRKFAVEDDSVSTEGRILSLAVLLRLAVVLHRSRSTIPLPHVAATGKNGQIALKLPKEWLDKHPLTKLDLEEEAEYLANSPVALKVKAV